MFLQLPFEAFYTVNLESLHLMCLAGAVANVSDSDRCCNPKVPSSILAGGKDIP